MQPRTAIRLAALVALLGVSSARSFAAESASPLPRLVQTEGTYQLLVDGEPFLMLGGQANNSTGTSAEVMAPLWDSLVAMHANTVEIPIYWSAIEPEPGRFDFQSLDAILDGARRHHLRVVPLWFGSWKNGAFDYAPDWIKRDPDKYFLAIGARPTLSPFCAAAQEVDARAFAAVMGHLKEVDGTQHTVILVQVENETGLIDTNRDYSAPATRAYGEAVPAALMRYLQDHRASLMPNLTAAWSTSHFREAGTWEELFGPELGPEIFSAWYVARYVDAVAAAGKKVYPLPMYVNCALKNPGDARPGDYNSGGPTINVLDVWKAAAPHIDLLTPDIYFPDFLTTAAAYRRADNPLFVPETGFFPSYAGYVFPTFATFDGLGFSPYGVDDGLKDGALTPAGRVLGEYYRLLENLMPLVAKYRGTGKLHAVLQDALPAPFGGARWRAQTISVGQGLAAVARFNELFSADLESPRAAGIIIELGPDEFIVAGGGFQVSFRELTGPARYASFFRVEEGEFRNGQWQTQRLLNGDELSFFPPTHATIMRVRLLRTTAGPTQPP